MAMNFTLRKAANKDLIFLFDLRNEKSVRGASFNIEPISLETHSKWFQNKLKDKDTQIFIIEVESRPMAMVRFDLTSDSEAEANVAVSEKFQGKGYGSEILRQSSVKFQEIFPKVNLIRAFIKPGNQASVRSFAKAGYQLTGEREHKGNFCSEMVLRRI